MPTLHDVLVGPQKSRRPENLAVWDGVSPFFEAGTRGQLPPPEMGEVTKRPRDDAGSAQPREPVRPCCCRND